MTNRIFMILYNDSVKKLSNGRLGIKEANMFELVEAAELKTYRKYCSDTLTKLRNNLNKSYDIVTQFTLVGSGASNLVTKNGDGPYDLDYNLIIIRMPNEYWNDLSKLKNKVMSELNKITQKTLFSDSKDSKSVITSLLHFNNTPQVEFSFDIAIIAKNKVGNYCRLIHNKHGMNTYGWEEVPKSNKLESKAKELKKLGYWPTVRRRYLELKNRYLSCQDDNHPSFVVYTETINQLYANIR